MRSTAITGVLCVALAWLGACGARPPVDDSPPGEVPDGSPAPPAEVPSVSLRRLTRAELERSLEALLGLDLDLRARLPDDDLVAGFDNQAEGLTVPELLLEQLDGLARELAEEVTARVHRPAPVRRVEVEALAPATGTPVELPSAEGTWWVLWGQAAPVQATLVLPEPGAYRLDVPAFSTWGPGVPQARVALAVDGAAVSTLTARAAEEAPDVLSWPLELGAGEHTFTLRLTNGSLSAGVAQDGESVDLSEVALGLDALELVGPLAADEGAPTALRARLVPCDPSEPREQLACAEQVLTELAPRAWRRPVTSPEVQDLLRFVEAALDAGESWDEGLATALHALLLSPHLLFRVERGEGAVEDGSRALSDHELATRLAYFLWSEPPDDELRGCADAGELHGADGPCALSAQVERLLADGRARALVERFGRPWLDLADPEAAEPATDALLEALLLGTAPLEAVVTGEGLSAELADPSRPGGVLALPELLRAKSSGGRTSVVKRGVLVAARLLCDPPEAPPPKVPMLEPGDNALAALDAHRDNPACSSCHAGFDPYGEALEGYDATGAPRVAYADGTPVPTRVELPGGDVVEGAAGLGDWLAAHPDLRPCLTAQLARYAWGVPLQTAGGLLHEVGADAQARGGSIADVLRAVALHPAFGRRPVEDGR